MYRANSSLKIFEYQASTSSNFSRKHQASIEQLDARGFISISLAHSIEAYNFESKSLCKFKSYRFNSMPQEKPIKLLGRGYLVSVNPIDCNIITWAKNVWQLLLEWVCDFYALTHLCQGLYEWLCVCSNFKVCCCMV